MYYLCKPVFSATNYLNKIVKKKLRNSCRSKKRFYLCTPNHNKNMQV